MGLTIYNTLTRKKESFETLEPGKVRMYVCGPTVYDKAHVGHAMSALVFDIMRRYLEYKGFQVRHVMNFTDVDDKIIQRAEQKGMDPFALGRMYIEEFQQHLLDLNILPATINPKATEEIDQIIKMISGLIEKGCAYQADGDVYFRVVEDDDYGKLSSRRLDDMQAGSRITVDERKEHPMDFALWKSARPGEPSWDSPWSAGRPGWHIECSAMNLHHLGEQIDIHGGGNDLIFPHHENEIAQSESFTEKQFARYWVHNGMLQLSGEKMSKSTGNLVTIEAFLSEHSGDTLRMMVLNSAYRGPLTFNDMVIAQAERALERLQSGLKPALPGSVGASQEQIEELSNCILRTGQQFTQMMDDDFNTSAALAALFDLVRQINQLRDAGATASDLEPGQQLLRQLSSVLGLRLDKAAADQQAADPFIELLLEIRTELRKNKLYELSDNLRIRLSELGVIIEDSRDGTLWHWS